MPPPPLVALPNITAYPPLPPDISPSGIVPDVNEIKQALFSLGNLKAPCLDGLHAIFFKSQWDILQPYVTNFVQGVFSTPSLIRDVNENVTTLIPMNDAPETPAYFRLVSLCNVIYKVVNKLIANRIRGALPSIFLPF
ncbi:hypothetical protein SESBI_17093 [Sesbania bispinosa]|nr:hypothetical protein SESBI_17093 [Sesbania bispinosa]